MVQSENLGLTVDLLTDATDAENDVPAHFNAANANFKSIDAWAATVAKKPVAETFEIETGGWAEIADKSPFTHSAQMTAATEIGEDTLVELINTDAVAFANYGFSIGAVTGQTVTVYSVGAPDEAVTLRLAIGG